MSELQEIALGLCSNKCKFLDAKRKYIMASKAAVSRVLRKVLNA